MSCALVSRQCVQAKAGGLPGNPADTLAVSVQPPEPENIKLVLFQPPSHGVAL